MGFEVMVPESVFGGFYKRFEKLFRRVNFAVHRAVRDGKLIRPTTCAECGKACKPEAHHFKGYAKEFWLVVKWLCRKCHMASHGSIS